jgi:hypothetical protein
VSANTTHTYPTLDQEIAELETELRAARDAETRAIDAGHGPRSGVLRSHARRIARLDKMLAAARREQQESGDA